MVDGDFKRYVGRWYLRAGPRFASATIIPLFTGSNNVPRQACHCQNLLHSVVIVVRSDGILLLLLLNIMVQYIHTVSRLRLLLSLFC